MPTSRARRSSLPRLLLRAGLLAGTALDGSLALVSLAVSYPSVTVPALGLRATLQGLACYDLHRYSQVIPWIGLSLAATAAAAAWDAAVPPAPAWTVLYSALGLAQLAAWWMAKP